MRNKPILVAILIYFATQHLACVNLMAMPSKDTRCFVNFKNANITGGCWEKNCKDAPNPLARIWIRGKVAWQTKVIANTFKPQWDQRSAAIQRDMMIRTMEIEIAHVDKETGKQTSIAIWNSQMDWRVEGVEIGYRIIKALYDSHSAYLVLQIQCSLPPPDD